MMIYSSGTSPYPHPTASASLSMLNLFLMVQDDLLSTHSIINIFFMEPRIKEDNRGADVDRDHSD